MNVQVHEGLNLIYRRKKTLAAAAILSGIRCRVRSISPFFLASTPQITDIELSVGWLFCYLCTVQQIEFN
jgi:hypothetical protein